MPLKVSGHWQPVRSAIITTNRFLVFIMLGQSNITQQLINQIDTLNSTHKKEQDFPAIFRQFRI